MHTVICPVCWHEETFRAIQQGTEPCHDDASSMRWQRPGGWARVQICTMWDGGTGVVEPAALHSRRAWLLCSSTQCCESAILTAIAMTLMRRCLKMPCTLLRAGRCEEEA